MQGTITHAHSAQTLWRDGVKDYTLCGGDRRLVGADSGRGRGRGRSRADRGGMSPRAATEMLAAHEAAPVGPGRRDPLELAVLYADDNDTLDQAAQSIRDYGNAAGLQAGAHIVDDSLRA
jgi:hypothetical protein